MNIKKYFKLYLVSILVFTFLFFLVFVSSINIIKSEIRTYLESGEFEKKIYSYTIKSITKFAETEPNQNDKIILKNSLEKIFENYKEVIPSSKE